MGKAESGLVGSVFLKMMLLLKIIKIWSQWAPLFVAQITGPPLAIVNLESFVTFLDFISRHKFSPKHFTRSHKFRFWSGSPQILMARLVMLF